MPQLALTPNRRGRDEKIGGRDGGPAGAKGPADPSGRAPRLDVYAESGLRRKRVARLVYGGDTPYPRTGVDVIPWTEIQDRGWE